MPHLVREFAPNHPWGCHRRRIPDRVVFDHTIGPLVYGSGYERIASPGCSDRTIRRRLTRLGRALNLGRAGWARLPQSSGVSAGLMCDVLEPHMIMSRPVITAQRPRHDFWHPAGSFAAGWGRAHLAAVVEYLPDG